VPVKCILAPVDFSPSSLHALACARMLAKRFHAELLVLHVVDQTYLAGAPQLTIANPGLAGILNEEWRRANAAAARLGARIQRQWRRSRMLVKRGAPWQTIVETAQRNGADLLVMATHGRTGLAHALIGSVTERVVRHAHCAVLTVRGSGGTARPAARARSR